jgi:hypothetical protein
LGICSTRGLEMVSISTLLIRELHFGVSPIHRIAKRLIVRFPPSVRQFLAADVDWPLWSALIRPCIGDGLGSFVNALPTQEPLHRQFRNTACFRQSRDGRTALVKPEYFMRIIRFELLHGYTLTYLKKYSTCVNALRNIQHRDCLLKPGKQTFSASDTHIR